MLNLKKLPAALKQCNSVVWFIHDYSNYIATDTFILKTGTDMTGSALTALVKLLGGIPTKEKGLAAKSGKVIPLTDAFAKSMVSLAENLSNVEDVAKDTNLLLNCKNLGTLSVYSIVGSYAYVNKIYTDMIMPFSDDLLIKGNSIVNPLYFTMACDMLMVLPIRSREESPYLAKGVATYGS